MQIDVSNNSTPAGKEVVLCFGIRKSPSKRWRTRSLSKSSELTLTLSGIVLSARLTACILVVLGSSALITVIVRMVGTGSLGRLQDVPVYGVKAALALKVCLQIILLYASIATR